MKAKNGSLGITKAPFTNTSSPDRARLALVFGLVFACAVAGCSSIPEPEIKKYTFPKDDAYIGVPKDLKPYEKLGLVRSKVDFPTMTPEHDEQELCRNYFNKAVRDLVKFAKEKGGEAVIDVKSVVFLMDGRSEQYPTPQCSDDGEGGQVLAQGVAIKWKKDKNQ